MVIEKNNNFLYTVKSIFKKSLGYNNMFAGLDTIDFIKEKFLEKILQNSIKQPILCIEKNWVN
jgi:aminopeptidase-like protein